MEPMKIAERMETIIRRLAEEGQRAEELIKAMSETTRLYKKGRAVRSIEHKDAGLPATLNKMQAEGDASQLEAEMILATQTLKAHFVKREDLRAQLNGYQSMNKHLSEI